MVLVPLAAVCWLCAAYGPVPVFVCWIITGLALFVGFFFGVLWLIHR